MACGDAVTLVVGRRIVKECWWSVMPQLHSLQHSWCVVFLVLVHNPSLSRTHSVCFCFSRCLSVSVQAERDASLSDLRSRLVCTAVLCSAWCFLSRPLVSLVMPLSIRGSEKPCWMPLARSSVMLAPNSAMLARSSVIVARSSVTLVQRYMKRVTLLSSCDRIW
jgi:hypothetical protein